MKFHPTQKASCKLKCGGAGKKSYNLTTTEKGTGPEQINKSLPKEIRNALGESKHEMEREEWGEKEKNIKHKWMKKHKKSKKKTKILKLSKNQIMPHRVRLPNQEKKIRLLQIEKDSLKSAYIFADLKNSDVPQREIEKQQAEENQKEISQNCVQITINVFLQKGMNQISLKNLKRFKMMKSQKNLMRDKESNQS